MKYHAKVELSVSQARPDETTTPRVLLPDLVKEMELQGNHFVHGRFSAPTTGTTVRIDLGTNLPRLILIYADDTSLYSVSVTWTEGAGFTGYDDVIVAPGRLVLGRSDNVAAATVTLAGVLGTATGQYFLFS